MSIVKFTACPLLSEKEIETGKYFTKLFIEANNVLHTEYITAYMMKEYSFAHFWGPNVNI